MTAPTALEIRMKEMLGAATTRQNQQKNEWCGELIDSGHKTILGLASPFGLAIVDEVGAHPAESTDALYFNGR